MNSENRDARKRLTRVSIRNAIIASGLFLFFYMMVVILTTPSLSPFLAVAIAINVNGIIISGLFIGIGIQSFLVTYSRQASCSRKMTRAAGGASAMGSALSSLLSFFALVPLGCCGTWLYIMSFLPGVLGVGVSGFVIHYSRILLLSGFVMMGVSILHTYMSSQSGYPRGK